MTLAVGLMSGTSGDGVSAAACFFKGRSFQILACRTFPYPENLRKKILNARELRASEISSLNFELGKIFAGATLKIIRLARLTPKKISAIGSHGQTIYHGPRDRVPSTFQIGEAAVIAEKTGIPVVSDFRPQDIALGGEGAPLVPFFDFYFYGGGPLRAFQNIGGIANVTVVGHGLKKPVAFDTGPGNCLMDLAIHKITKGRLACDPSGKWAARGLIDRRRIAAMIRHPYFRKRPPKSTGREEFGEEFLKKHFGASLRGRPCDTLATLNYFTALAIYQSLKPFAMIKEIVVSGGGALSITLMKNLKRLFAPHQNRGQVPGQLTRDLSPILSPVLVHGSEDFGIPVQAREPLAFAFLALRALQGKANHLPETTGASRRTILGKITHPDARR